MLDRTAQIACFRERIIVEKINQLAARLFDGGVALHGGLPSAHE